MMPTENLDLHKRMKNLGEVGVVYLVKPPLGMAAFRTGVPV